MIKIDELKLEVDYTEQDLLAACAKKLGIKTSDILSLKLLKKSIDARRKPHIFYSLSVSLVLKGNLENKFPDKKYEEVDYSLHFEQKTTALRPVVVGFGPSGMFAALCLAKMGLRPIVLEQGKCVEDRDKDVHDFWTNRKLNIYSNVQFGEGGAGTFSDGKLNTNVNNYTCKQVLHELYRLGAPEQILYEAKAHIGSDKLKKVVVSLRKEVISLGGEIYFSTKLQKINCVDGCVKSILAQNVLTGEEKIIATNHLLLCLGHSARDTFRMLHASGVEIRQKPFAMGVRIEQKQEDINTMQYGKGYNKNLPSADYKLVCHLPNGRSVFTFCMCPGGEVVASSSGEGEIVTNGMSDFARGKENANSALLVNVLEEDYATKHPLSGLDFQAQWEKKAYELGGKNYNAPAQSVGEFLGKKIRTNINPTYRPGITLADLSKCLPDFVCDSLRQGLPLLNQKAKGFAKDENLLIGIETRSSSPITIVRSDTFETNIKGIYPVGEGAGYAGGIVTSAQDGIKVSTSIYNNL